MNDFLNKNMFMVANTFEDVWFWDQDYLGYLGSHEFLEQVFNYYMGVKELHNEHELLITMSEHDFNFVCYAPRELDEETNIKLKNLRRF